MSSKIRIATSIPSLKDKVKIDLEGSTDAIRWFIRFNIPLDESTVSDKTMDVTDTDGYIMRTEIAYNQKSNVITISPFDTYEQNRFYLLNISKKVRSARGQNLKSTIHILFKLYGNEVTDYHVLKKNANVPKPKPRPKDYDVKQKSRKPNTFDREYQAKGPRDQMTTVGYKINMVVGIIGLAVASFGYFLNFYVTAAGALICLSGIVHVYFQIQRSELKSTLYFNNGVRKFNRRRYREAGISFEKSLSANPENELAKYGLYKAGLYNN